jgi:metallophosphoesterase superfamily enzyme
MKLDTVRKIFVLGDLHLGIRNNSIEWSEIQSQYLIDHFIKTIDEEGFNPETDILVQVGDWNHVRESTNVRIYKLSLKIADVLTKKFKRGLMIGISITLKLMKI